jgi:hypothetical protein
VAKQPSEARAYSASDSAYIFRQYSVFVSSSANIQCSELIPYNHQLAKVDEMKLEHISVENYKGLNNIECNISDFVCAVGEPTKKLDMLEQELNRNGDGLSIEELEKESEASEADAIEGELEIVAGDQFLIA